MRTAAIAFLLTWFATGALAQGHCEIGLYADPEGTISDFAPDFGVPFTVYVLATVDEHIETAAYSLDFGTANIVVLPGTRSYGPGGQGTSISTEDGELVDLGGCYDASASPVLVMSMAILVIGDFGEFATLNLGPHPQAPESTGPDLMTCSDQTLECDSVPLQLRAPILIGIYANPNGTGNAIATCLRPGRTDAYVVAYGRGDLEHVAFSITHYGGVFLHFDESTFGPNGDWAGTISGTDVNIDPGSCFSMDGGPLLLMRFQVSRGSLSPNSGVIHVTAPSGVPDLDPDRPALWYCDGFRRSAERVGLFDECPLASATASFGSVKARF